ncbi:WxL domain-containing protein [Dellaglioa sp. BT-FLS60]
MKLSRILVSSMALMSLSALATPAFAADVNSKDSKADATFTENTTDPEGDLTLTHVSDISFGSKEISGSDITYPVDTVTANAKVTDNRGSNAGWTVKVANTEFATDAKDALTAATFELTNSSSTNDNGDKYIATPAKSVKLDGSGNAVDYSAAKANTGMGVTESNFADGALTVPGTTKKVKDTLYTSTLTWTLTDDALGA